jgi:hypothetical protein
MPVTSQARPRLGSVAWERAGGPPLTFGQKIGLLGGAGAVILSDLGPRLMWRIGLPVRRPAKIDLSGWDPPDTRAAREAESFLHEVSSGPMVNHSLRTYWFSALIYELAAGAKPAIDREALYVAAVLHDVGLFAPAPPPDEHCFTVASAREARRIATGAGWDEARQDRMAAAITSNLNAFVAIDEFGPEAHFLRVGGLVEVIAQEWKVHPDNLAPILERYPRTDFVDDTLVHIRREIALNPGCRFACLNPVFPTMLKIMRFRQDRGTR